MDLKLVTLFAALAFVVVHTSEATLFPVAFNCCTEVSQHVSRKLLKEVLQFEIQKDDGVCNLPAVILYVKQKKLCVSTQNKNIKKWMKRNRIKNRRRDGNLHSGKNRNTTRKDQIVVKQ
ncbi:C-C motif chemokine 28 [Emydura macquarii macquarii]|uniref:C-C motif chemokine 28 n=1 Tax=Emydura macquarii macquarii TaxID=1129001 RepID=UPI00352B70EF